MFPFRYLLSAEYVPGMVVDPGDIAGKETHTDLSLKDEENETRGAPGKERTETLCLFLVLHRIPHRAQGLPHAMPLAGVEKPSEREGCAQPRVESGSGQQGQC